MIMKVVPQSHHDLLSDDMRAFAFLATIMADGTPQVTPVWFNIDETHLIINSARGRTKDRNMRKRSQVAVAVPDPRNPYRYLQIRGPVVEITEENAREHIDALSKKYTGKERYTPRTSYEVRVMYKIYPERVTVKG